MNNCNSPIISKLRSNKNYRPTVSLIANKQRVKPSQVVSQVPVQDFDHLVNQICEPCELEDVVRDEELFANFDFEDEPFDSEGFNYNNISIADRIKDNLVNQMNNLKLDDKSETWHLSISQKNGYKLYSLGYCYVVDKPKFELVKEAEKIYWRCEFFKDCKGRGNSKGLLPPFKVTKEHNHMIKPEKKESLDSKQLLKQMAIRSNDQPRALIRDFQLTLSDECISTWSKKDAIRQLIIRTRNAKSGCGFNAKCLQDLEIPESLKSTYKGSKFYYGDSGKDDQNRIIFFTTQQNLKLMSSYNDWYCDGTFDISPTIFKQVYSVHIIVRGTTLPMLYALLPNKSQKTYKKLFKLILQQITKKPNFVNCDFELAAINALRSVFGCKIFGCFFHLSQSFWRRVQSCNLKLWFSSDFRQTFRKVQALAFIPCEDVFDGFELIRTSSPNTARQFLDYVENNYIGKLKGNKLSKARFPIELWNLHERVKLDLPRTNNNVESWHSRIKPDSCKNLTVKKVVEFFRLEQNNMETDLVLLFNGEQIKVIKKKC